MTINTSLLRVSLALSDFDCDPDEITKLLNVNPSHITRKGDLNSKNRKIQQFNIWSIDSGLKDNMEVDAHVLRLLSVIPSLEKLRKEFPSLTGTINCVAHVGEVENAPVMWLSDTAIQGMARLGVSFGIDYYVVSSQKL